MPSRRMPPMEHCGAGRLDGSQGQMEVQSKSDQSQIKTLTFTQHTPDYYQEGAATVNSTFRTVDAFQSFERCPCQSAIFIYELPLLVLYSFSP